MSVIDSFKVDHKIALVTGGAGQLGRQFCKALSEAGAHVFMADKEEQIKQIEVDLLRSDNGKIEPLVIDVTDENSVKNGIQSIVDRCGCLDILVNNAGIAIFESFEDRTVEKFNEVVDINLKGTFLCIQKAVEVMKANQEGSCIVNIGSVYGVVSGDPRIYTDCNRNTSEVYGATKAGIIQMTRYFSVHLAPFNIRVNSISPGGIYNNQGKDFVAQYSSRTPLGRMCREDELNGALLFLISKASSYITGHNLVVDGGWTAW